MDIDESTHQAKVGQKITEDGKIKKEWTAPQGVSTVLVLVEMAKGLLEDLNHFMIERMKEDEK